MSMWTESRSGSAHSRSPAVDKLSRARAISAAALERASVPLCGTMRPSRYAVSESAPPINSRLAFGKHVSLHAEELLRAEHELLKKVVGRRRECRADRILEVDKRIDRDASECARGDPIEATCRRARRWRRARSLRPGELRAHEQQSYSPGEKARDNGAGHCGQS